MWFVLRLLGVRRKRYRSPRRTQWELERALAQPPVSPGIPLTALVLCLGLAALAAYAGTTPSPAQPLYVAAAVIATLSALYSVANLQRTAVWPKTVAALSDQLVRSSMDRRYSYGSDAPIPDSSLSLLAQAAAQLADYGEFGLAERIHEGVGDLVRQRFLEEEQRYPGGSPLIPFSEPDDSDGDSSA